MAADDSSKNKSIDDEGPSLELMLDGVSDETPAALTGTMPESLLGEQAAYTPGGETTVEEAVQKEPLNVAAPFASEFSDNSKHQAPDSMWGTSSDIFSTMDRGEGIATSQNPAQGVMRSFFFAAIFLVVLFALSEYFGFTNFSENLLTQGDTGVQVDDDFGLSVDSDEDLSSDEALDSASNDLSVEEEAPDAFRESGDPAAEVGNSATSPEDEIIDVGSSATSSEDDVSWVDNPYWNLPNDFSQNINKPNLSWDVDREEVWRDKLSSKFIYQQYSVLKEVRDARLRGSEVLLWDMLEGRKVWLRMKALMALADFGEKVTMRDTQTAIGDARQSTLANFFKRFRAKASVGELFVLRQLVRTLDSRARFEVLKVLSNQRDVFTNIYLTAATYDPDFLISAWAKRQTASLAEAEFTALVEVIQQKAVFEVQQSLQQDAPVKEAGAISQEELDESSKEDLDDGQDEVAPDETGEEFEEVMFDDE